MLARATREHPEIDFRHSEGAATSEPAESADAIVLFAVLTSIPDNDDQLSLISECRRVLRVGGDLYVSDLCLNDDARNQSRYDKYQDEFGVRRVFRLDDMEESCGTIVVSLVVDAGSGCLRTCFEIA